MARTADRIGRYRIRELIGTGDFATVYRATDERLGVDVAVKVLAENYSLDPDVRERFIAEGRRLRRVRNPHLITVHDLGDTERAQPYLVLEWADRGDLASRVADAWRRGRPPAPADALAVARVAADVLGALHDHQIAHRDLTPSNLLLSSTAPSSVGSSGPGPPAPAGLGASPLIANDEQLLLADLGLSKDLAVTSGLNVTEASSGFAPPELRERAGAVDSHADVWAASALIVWLAIDHPPDEAGWWQRELRDAGWPSEAGRVLARGLASRARDRCPTIGEWLAALEAALLPPSAEPARVVSGTALTRQRREAMALVVVVLLASVLGAFAFRVLTRGPAVHTEHLADGRERTTVQEHGITIVVEGPTTATVGERERLTATISGTDTWTWVGADGVLLPGTESFGLVARSAGRATVRLLATDGQGRLVEATHPMRVSQDNAAQN